MIARIIAISLLFFCLQISAQNDSIKTSSIDDISTTICGSGQRITKIYTDASSPDMLSSKFIDGIFQQQSFTQIIDNYVDDAHVHLETTAGYDKPNPFMIGFTGASYKWTRYYYNGLRINNPLIPGDALYHFNLENSNLRWDSYSGNISISSYIEKKRTLSVEGLTGKYLGDRVGFTDWFINNISGHRSAAERAIFDIERRPHSQWHTEITYSDNISTKPLYLNIFGGNRVHIDQDYSGKNTSYSEQYVQLLAAGKLTNKRHILGDGLDYIFLYKERNHFGGEYNYNRNETSKLFQLSTSIYSKKELVDKGSQITGLHINALRTAPIETNFSRNIIDQDGEGLHPYSQDGRQQSIGLYFKREQKLKSSLSVIAEANNTLLFHKPSQSQKRNSIYRQSNADNYLSLHAIDWNQEPFISALLENSVNLEHRKKHGRSKVVISGGIHLLGMQVKENAMTDLGLSASMTWQNQLSNKWNVGVKLGFYPNRYDVDQIRLLSPEYMNGTARYWTDTNNDKRAQDDELGDIAFTTGGQYYKKAENLGLSYTYYMDIPITLKASKQWSWTLITQYRQYRNTWYMEYDQPLEEYGSYQSIGNKEIWFSNGEEKNYIVQPLSKERMNYGRDGGLLFEQPFYGGVTFRFEHNSKSWFFSGSMTANMIVGYSGLGNGPLHNNINSPSETTANPNTHINQVGRLDTDRSFISRILANYKYDKNGSIGITLKYKDGQSFAFYEHFVSETNGNREIAFYQPEVRGDNPLTGDRGRREDFFTNFEIHAQRQFLVAKGFLKMRITIHNLLDFANETSEYVYGNVEGFSRSPLELHVPRSASMVISYSW